MESNRTVFCLVGGSDVAIVWIMEKMFHYMVYFLILNAIAIICVIVVVRMKNRKGRAKEERLAFGNDEVIRMIDFQLKGVDRQSVLEKTPLLYQKTVGELRELLSNREITHEELVAYYLLRIRDIDQAPNGCNAIIEVNPRAIETARRLDREMTNANAVERQSPIHGIPVLLKDNINTCDMPTSAGSIALKDWVPEEDAPMVKKLREAGAILLGKTNLSEMSFYMSTIAPNGYSAKKGQTLSPFAPLRLSAGGSSTGSAVAMATDLAALSYGTETIGSIVSPSSANSVVGFKPSRSTSNISNQGVIPITTRMDTVGPIAKCVKDAAMATEVTRESSQKWNIDWDPNYLKGKALRIERTGELDKYLEERLLHALRTVDVYVAVVDGKNKVRAPKVLEADFERCINAYLVEHDAPIRSLKEWVKFNQEDPGWRLRYGQRYMEEAARKDRAEMLTELEIEQMIEDARGQVSAVTHPRADGFDAWVFIGSEGAPIACLSGAPEITVPFGVGGPEMKPVGVTFVGRLDADEDVLKLAYSFEQLLGYRVFPN